MPDTDLTILNRTGPAAIFAALPWLTPSYHNGYKSPFENYLADPAQGIEAGEVDEGVKDEYTSLSLEVFAQRLALIINTALRVSYYSPAVLGFSKVSLTAIAATRVTPRYSYTYGNAAGELITSKRRYWIQTSWIAMYMVSLILMILAIVVVLALRLIVRAPDFLTNVSALTRDSAYMNVPAGGSTLAGEEPARLLKDRRLRIRDVQPGQEFGYAALADDVGYESKKGLKLDGRVYT